MSDLESQHFTIVEFIDDGNSVAIINSSWLTPRKNRTFWPHTRDRKEYQRILQDSDPDFSNWEVYKVRCLYETDNLEKAREKLKLSEATSDLQSEAEGPKKRKITKKVFSSEEESQDDDPFPRPPKVKKVPNRQGVKKNLTLLIEYDESLQLLSPVKIKTTPSHSSFSYDGNIADAGSTGSSITPFTGIASISSRLRNIEHIISTAKPYPGNAPVSSGVNREGTTTEFQEKVILLLTQIKEQNAKLIQMYKEDKRTTSSGIIKDLPVELPVDSEANLNILKNYLNDEEKLILLVKYLSKISGGDLTNRVNRILKHLLTDSVASLFNFLGKGQRKSHFIRSI